jgi:predicted ATPase/DNA-binding XRE family transcriptional regulator
VLRRLREQAGLTQEELAERAGLSANAVSALERGVRNRPHRHTREALAIALGVTAAERADWDAAVAPRLARVPLPVAPSPLLGRGPDVEEVVRLLATERIVTLTGPGGVGKTRLALAVAEQVRYRDGVVFVPLAAVADPGDVLPAVAQALGLREIGPRDVAQVLAAYLRPRRLLLVLDNVEHLLAAAPGIAALVAAAGEVGVLATSRAPLRIRGERVRPVPALPADIAAELFAVRAEQATGRPLGPDPVVARLCARLDHLPLAIELAAAQTRLLSPAQLLRRFETAVLGSAGPRDAQPRHQTLRAVVGWSYALLAPAEQVLLRRVAVFAGGWTLAAATELAGLSEADALAAHLALLDHSLIVRDETNPEHRFDMLETVRAFALDGLAAAGERAATTDRHATLFAESAAGAAVRLWSADQADALDALEADHDNLRAALRHMLDTGRVDELATACHDTWLFWVVRGHLRDPHTLAVAALATEPGPTIRAKLHLVVGCTQLPRGAYDDAAAHFAAAAAAAVGPTRGVALAWGANAEVYRGRPEAAAALLAQLDTDNQIDREQAGHVASYAVIGHAHIAIATGAMAAADTLLTARVPEIEQRAAAWPLAVALGIHGRVAAVLGDTARADTMLTRSVRMFGELGDTWGMAHQLTHLADIAAQRGEHTRAALLYGAVDVLTEQFGAHVFHIWQDLSDQCQATALGALGVERFTALRRQGRTLSPADVVTLAADG